MFLLGPVFDPVKAHVDGFRPFLFYGGGVIDTDWFGRLGMSDFGKGGTNGDSLLAVE